jgi:hypothetical protein
MWPPDNLNMDEGTNTKIFVFAEDLEGLKVSHDFDDMAEGEARILTLKDSRVLDNEGLWLSLLYVNA